VGSRSKAENSDEEDVKPLTEQYDEIFQDARRFKNVPGEPAPKGRSYLPVAFFSAEFSGQDDCLFAKML
jgi:hypothetical protein